MCKPFPPPLVRGGVFLVGLETKYRDIADGNVAAHNGDAVVLRGLETKYRDIADGNTAGKVPGKTWNLLETKYRDIADGNFAVTICYFVGECNVGNQVPRYSGWKPHGWPAHQQCWHFVGNQVPRYSGWKRHIHRHHRGLRIVGNQVPRYSGWKPPGQRECCLHPALETKYRDIADGVTKQIIRQARCRTWRI